MKKKKYNRGGGVEARLKDLSDANRRVRAKELDKKTKETLRRGERMQGEEQRSESKLLKNTRYRKGGSVRGCGKAQRGLTKGTMR